MKPKFVFGIGLIIVAVVAVMVFTIIGNSSMEVQVNDLLAKRQAGQIAPDRSLKLIGWVVGDSIVYDPNTLHLEFDVVHSREDLFASPSNAQRVRVVYRGVKPDTLMHEARAIVTGKMNSDGKFYAGNSPDALLLQCPTRYEDAAKEASK
ncbi:MAG: cytochrome c maturation protein CcmE [Thermoflexales bacterium]|nr:cytochrome c maturation protein CcmE [Thermoflexales bacterium]MDW8350487.1 cytochrome c maturation protein CcmE [Anaerolineae bacterium]